MPNKLSFTFKKVKKVRETTEIYAHEGKRNVFFKKLPLKMANSQRGAYLNSMKKQL